MITLKHHQVLGVKWVVETLNTYNLAYLAWEERTGKTFTALGTIEHIGTKVLILTKKKALSGWVEAIRAYKLKTHIEVTNYESFHKVKDPHKFNYIIFDEAHHSISGFPKASNAFNKIVKSVNRNVPMLFLSATPYAEHIGLIYHQLNISLNSPFKHIGNGYGFHRVYGVQDIQYNSGTPRESYKKFRDDAVYAQIGHLFDYKTRVEVGIGVGISIQEIQVKPTKEQLEYVKQLDTGIIEIGDYTIPMSSASKEFTSLYQLEGGTLKHIDEAGEVINLRLKSQPKLSYLLKLQKEKINFCVMANFIEERAMLEESLPNITILSADGHAEGIDLSMFDVLVIYSMSFRTSKHQQRLARQANFKRVQPIIVHILTMSKPFIGSLVLETVERKKENFISNSYKRRVR